MAPRLGVVLFLILPLSVQAQVVDSVGNSILLLESVTLKGQDKLDSIQIFTVKEYESLKRSYDSVVATANRELHRLQVKNDSLQNLNISTGKLSSKSDSLTTWKEEKIRSITSKVEKLKSAVIEKIDRHDLPAELNDKAAEVASLMNKLDVTLPNTRLPESFQQQLNVGMPNLAEAVTVPDLPAIDLGRSAVPNMNVSSISTETIGEQVQQYQNQIAPTTLDGAAKLAEDQATKITEVANVQNELGNASELAETTEMFQDQEKLKEQLVQQVKEQAIDHFAGQQEQLNSAMQSISKYKKRYASINSLSDIRRKRPNEMKGKALIERIVPGIAIQLQKKNDFLFTDFNPYVGYRFTGRLTAGAGWNERVSYNLDDNKFESESRIYGPRAFGEFKLWRGFSPRLEIETMNTFVPPYIKRSPADVGQREWVWGVFAGIKKDYKLFKKINGTALVMFRLFDPERKSPYADVVNARFGFEIPVKKRVSKKRIE